MKIILSGKCRAVVITLVVLLYLTTGCSRQPVYPAATRIGTNIVIEQDSLAPDVPKFFTYRHQGRKINYFVVRTDGKILSFLDACASCYPHKKGYTCKDRHVTCGFCSQEFPLNKLERGLGGCFPIRIEGRLENGKYLLPVAALEAEAGKF